jgi:hypothetical protein
MPRPALWLAGVAIIIASAAGFGAGLSLKGSGARSPVLAATPSPVAGDSREAEYAKLAQLRGGLTLEYFRQILGVPLFVTHSRDGAFVQYLFRGRDYWVQAVSDTSAESVLLVAITSCNPDFQPAFQVGGNDIVLKRSRLADLPAPQTLRYFTSGATANSFYYDQAYYGNPGLYKTYFLGVNDACGPAPPAILLRPFLSQD